MLSPYTFLCPPLYLSLLYHANRPERYSRQHLEQKTVFLRFCHTIFVSWGRASALSLEASLFRSIFPRDTRWRGICAYIPSIKPVSAKMQLSGLVVVLLLLGTR